VNEVLHEIGIDASSALLVLNKIDQVADRSLVDVLRAKHPFAISVSALTRQGLDRLARTVAEQFGGGFVEADIDAPAANGRLHAYLAEHAELLGTSYHDDRVRFHCRLARRFTADLPGDDVRCTVRGDGVAAPRGERSNGAPPVS
jgi:GTP-binding protein HflX